MRVSGSVSSLDQKLEVTLGAKPGVKLRGLTLGENSHAVSDTPSPFCLSFGKFGTPPNLGFLRVDSVSYLSFAASDSKFPTYKQFLHFGI
jgi:hypothetical protein